MILLKSLLPEKKSKYQLFVDMDGVLADFEGGFKRLSGRDISSLAKRQFWAMFFGIIKKKASEGNYSEKQYWAELEWMSDGKTLWQYVKQYNPTLLTAPPNSQSEAGKKQWVSKRLGSAPIIFKQARDKPQYSKKDAILIDDRASTVDGWNAKGGIGILHTSASNTIRQLKKLGL